MQECSSACAAWQPKSTLTFPRSQLPLPGFRCWSIIAVVALRGGWPQGSKGMRLDRSSGHGTVLQEG
jgi:hypothetical protein